MLSRIKEKRYHIALLFILLLTAFLTIWKIWQIGDANAYYTAAVKSMLQSWHNFFYASFDPGGFISVDKPALGLWLQAAFAAIFGVHGWSVALPEALCAVASVALLYHLVQRGFGKPAGLLAALMLALTPIFIAVARTNNLDSSLTLVMLLSAWAAAAAAERGRLRLLLLSMAILGIGFNIKMLQACMALPAILLVYFFTAKTGWLKRAAHITAGAAVLLAVSLSWALAVDLTPADSRPYVGGSSTNSVLELAVDYNGIQRVLPGGSPGRAGGFPDGSARPQDGGFQGMNMPGGMSEGGEAGILRLFNMYMAGQASWLIPLALFGMLALALSLRRKAEGVDRKTALRHLLLWAGWVLPMAAYFSIAGFFHRYYLSVLSPGLAALAGIGAALLWKKYRRGGWEAWLLPAAIAATAAVQCIILSRYDGNAILPILCAVAGIAVAALTARLIMRRNASGRIVPAFAAMGVAALLAAPAAWSYTPILYGIQAQLPIAGPELQSAGWPGGFAAGGAPRGSYGDGGASALIQFLTEHSGGEKYLVAVPDAGTAESIILATGKPVMAVGGFLGSDPALTVEKLAQMVKDGQLRYYMVENYGRDQNELTQWVTSHGKAVSAGQWGGRAPGGRGGNGTLYDLAPQEQQ